MLPCAIYTAQSQLLRSSAPHFEQEEPSLQAVLGGLGRVNDAG